MIAKIESSALVRWSLYILVAALTAYIYAGGVHGPFLLDDGGNLDTIARWSEGRLDWRGAIDNRSGLLGRPLAMLTFLFDAWRTGSAASPAFKPTNVAIHLLCGALTLSLARAIFLRVDASKPLASTLALFLAATWLLLPLQVSTVLYIVQRMAQLAALFTFAALICFLWARKRLADRGDDPKGLTGLWIAFPGIVCLGLLSKENAALAVPLAAVFEVCLFQPPTPQRRPLSVRMFFGLAIGVPVLAIVTLLAIKPGIIATSYAGRDFTLSERVLTEPRVLWDYIRTLLLPVGPDMGLFHDNYPISRSLTDPISTSFAFAAWIVATGIAFAVRRSQPLISTGIGFFLAGHLLESTAIPLEIYFEHRNYLPAFGLLLAVFGVIVAARQRLHSTTQTFRRAVSVSAISLPMIYAAGTWIQVGSWADQATLYAMQESYNPTSPRLQSVLAARAIETHDLDGALRHIAWSERYGNPSELMTATIWRFIAYCEKGDQPPDSIYDQFAQRTPERITTYAMTYWEKLVDRSEQGCKGLDQHRLVTLAREWISNDRSPQANQTIWRTRYNLARLEASQGDLTTAETDARESWKDSEYNVGIGVFVFQLNATMGRTAECEEILSRLKKDANMGNADLREAILLFQHALDSGQIKKP